MTPTAAAAAANAGRRIKGLARNQAYLQRKQAEHKTHVLAGVARLQAFLPRSLKCRAKTATFTLWFFKKVVEDQWQKWRHVPSQITWMILMRTESKLKKLRAQATALAHEIKAAETTRHDEIKQRALQEIERSGLMKLDVDPATVGAAIAAAITQLRNQPTAQEQCHD